MIADIRSGAALWAAALARICRTEDGYAHPNLPH